MSKWKLYFVVIYQSKTIQKNPVYHHVLDKLKLVTDSESVVGVNFGFVIMVTYLLDESCYVEAGEWCLFSRFKDNSVSTCECRTELPCCHHQREVPLCVTHTHTHRGTHRDTHTHTGKRHHASDWHNGWSQIKLNNSLLLSNLLSFSLCLNIVKWENVLGTCTVFSLPTVFWESREIATHVQ